jgi:hypothetical protein
MSAGESGVISMTDPLTGEDVFAAYAPIAENGWSISLLIPHADLLGGVVGLSFSLLALIGAAIGALAGIGLLFSASFVRPLIPVRPPASPTAICSKSPSSSGTTRSARWRRCSTA